MSTRLNMSDTMDYEDRLCKTVEQCKALLIEKEKLAEQCKNLQQECTILTAKAEESIHLKDELDIAREEASNILRLSTTIEQLRKHADEVVSLRLRCSQLENDNQICVQRLTELEQETRLDGNIRSKVKAQARLQIEDAQFLANEAIKRAELAEQNLLKVRQELINVNREKEVCMFLF
uniref:Hook C-terminal domain-containing protein n=1 Tax=Schistosoma haematobium TaxID=6185 RepID=A0A095CEZ9_SCHHA